MRECQKLSQAFGFQRKKREISNYFKSKSLMASETQSETWFHEKENIHLMITVNAKQN